MRQICCNASAGLDLSWSCCYQAVWQSKLQGQDKAPQLFKAKESGGKGGGGAFRFLRPGESDMPSCTYAITRVRRGIKRALRPPGSIRTDQTLVTGSASPPAEEPDYQGRKDLHCHQSAMHTNRSQTNTLISSRSGCSIDAQQRASSRMTLRQD